MALIYKVSFSLVGYYLCDAVLARVLAMALCLDLENFTMIDRSLKCVIKLA